MPDAAAITLRPVTRDNVFDIIGLSDTLESPKRDFVAPNAVSLAQAYCNPAAWARGIYAGDEPVGFLMLDDNAAEQEYFLWRFMIAQPHHGKGYGRQAVNLLVEYVRSRPGGTALHVSCLPGKESPVGFYRRLGFEPTGEFEGEEMLLRMPLEPLAPAATKEARQSVSTLLNETRGMALLYAAARLGIADHLSAAPLTLDALAGLTDTRPEFLYRFARVLKRHGLVTIDTQAQCALTSLGACLKEGDSSDLKGRALIEGALHTPAWLELVHNLKTGEPALNHALGKGYFDYCADHPELSAAFNRAMVRGTQSIAPKVVQSYDFTGFGTIVDIGGGIGGLLSVILDAAPSARGILFDRPEVVAQAPSYLEAQGLGDRCETAGGDFFEAVPSGGDAYTLKWILHDWDDTACVKILRSIRAAVQPEAVVLVIDWVVPEDAADSPAFEGDLSMMVLAGGKERTESEFRGLFEQSGFSLSRVIPLGENGRSIVETRPV